MFVSINSLYCNVTDSVFTLTTIRHSTDQY